MICQCKRREVARVINVEHRSCWRSFVVCGHHRRRVLICVCCYKKLEVVAWVCYNT